MKKIYYQSISNFDPQDVEDALNAKVSELEKSGNNILQLTISADDPKLHFCILYEKK